MFDFSIFSLTYASDEGTHKDIPIWSDKVGQEFLGSLEAEEGYDRLFVKRGK